MARMLTMNVMSVTFSWSCSHMNAQSLGRKEQLAASKKGLLWKNLLFYNTHYCVQSLYLVHSRFTRMLFFLLP